MACIQSVANRCLLCRSSAADECQIARWSESSVRELLFGSFNFVGRPLRRFGTKSRHEEQHLLDDYMRFCRKSTIAPSHPRDMPLELHFH